MRLNVKDPFLQRFENRCEKIGEGGIFDVPLKYHIITNYKKELKQNLFKSDKKQNSILSKMKNKYNALTIDEYCRIPTINIKPNENEKNMNDISNIINNKSQGLNRIMFNNIKNNNLVKKNINIINKSNNENKKEKILFKNIKIQNNSFPKNQKIIPKINNITQRINKNLNINERFYRPYSLKDYKIIMENYKKEKFGGLGINMNKAWLQRQKIYNKVKIFENSVYQNFNKRMNEYNFKKVETPRKMELMKMNDRIKNSKRFLAQKYGKGVMLNKIREKRKEEKEEIKLLLMLKNQNQYIKNKNRKNIINVYDNVINNKKEDYQAKLLELKSSLL